MTNRCVWLFVLFFLNRPVYPEEEADDENVVEDSTTAELDLTKPDEDNVMVRLPLPLFTFTFVIDLFKGDARLFL